MELVKVKVLILWSKTNAFKQKTCTFWLSNDRTNLRWLFRRENFQFLGAPCEFSIEIFTLRVNSFETI